MKRILIIYFLLAAFIAEAQNKNIVGGYSANDVAWIIAKLRLEQRKNTPDTANIAITTDTSGNIIFFNKNNIRVAQSQVVGLADSLLIKASVAALNAHTTNTGNPHNVTKAQVGLGNVPNVDATNPANITQSSTYRFATDAEKTAWNAKENAIAAGSSGQYYSWDKTWRNLDKAAVGLSNVDNTSDAAKPISTATQAALDAKQNTLTAGTGISIASNTIANTGVTSVNGSTGAVTGVLTNSNVSGTANYLPMFTATNTVGNSIVQQYSTTGIGIGTSSNAGHRLDVRGGTGNFDSRVFFAKDNFNSLNYSVRGSNWLSPDNETGFISPVHVVRTNSGDAAGFRIKLGSNGKSETQTTTTFSLEERTDNNRFCVLDAQLDAVTSSNSHPTLILRNRVNFGGVRQQFINSYNVLGAEFELEDQDVSNKQVLTIKVNTGSSPTSVTRFVTFDGNKRMGINTGTKTPNTAGGWSGLATSTLHVKGDNWYNQFRLETQGAPSGTSDANGNTGDFSADDNYLYYKTSTGWKRIAWQAIP